MSVILPGKVVVVECDYKLLKLIKQAEKGNAGLIFYNQKLITLEEAKNNVSAEDMVTGENTPNVAANTK